MHLNFTGAFNICCPRDCVSRHNGGTSGAPLKPLRDDSVLNYFIRCAAHTMHYADAINANLDTRDCSAQCVSLLLLLLVGNFLEWLDVRESRRHH